MTGATSSRTGGSFTAPPEASLVEGKFSMPDAGGWLCLGLGLCFLGIGVKFALADFDQPGVLYGCLAMLGAAAPFILYWVWQRRRSGRFALTATGLRAVRRSGRELRTDWDEVQGVKITERNGRFGVRVITPRGKLELRGLDPVGACGWVWLLAKCAPILPPAVRAQLNPANTQTAMAAKRSFVDLGVEDVGVVNEVAGRLVYLPMSTATKGEGAALASAAILGVGFYKKLSLIDDITPHWLPLPELLVGLTAVDGVDPRRLSDFLLNTLGGTVIASLAGPQPGTAKGHNVLVTLGGHHL